MRVSWLTRVTRQFLPFQAISNIYRGLSSSLLPSLIVIFSTGSEGILGVWAGQETTETRSVSPPQLREGEKNGKGTGNVYLEEAACENMTRGSL